MKRSITLLTTIVLVASLSGCADLQLSRMLQSVSETARDRHGKNLGRNAEQLLQRKNPEEVFRLLDENPRHQEQLKIYQLRAVNLLITQAESAEQKGHYLVAGQHYNMALHQFPMSDRGDQIDLNRQDLQNRLNRCAGKLLQSGLHSYRIGELEKAIDIWSQIRTFNPAYKPSELAIQTTKIQIKELEKLVPGS